ncbi:MAG: type II secretion system F family protein [Anaerolineaceae bacterium]|nr:type II secretion system F family protein [Anaerolineaceae bacterium]
MAIYQFEAMNAQGQEVRDEVEATSQEDAVQKIRGMNYFPTQIREKGGSRKARGAAATEKKKGKTLTIGGVSQKHLTMFTRQLSTLQDAGLPILRSLRILYTQQKPGALKNALGDVIEDVEAGSTLSEAMAKHGKCFNRLYVNIVRAGEAGGVLDRILLRLAEFMEKSLALRRRVIGAMIYPVMVIVVATGIVAAIMIAIIPRFKKIFDDFGTTLPGPTKMLISLSDFFVHYWFVFLIVPAVLYMGLRLVKMSDGGRYSLDWFMLQIPLVGGIVNRSAVARFARTLGTLIASGVPILEALKITRDTVGNEVISRALAKVHDSIREGESISAPLKQSGVVDAIVVNMIDVGEETGVLTKVADNYDEEVDALVGGLVSALEPIMVVVLGMIVGSIVICLFLPLVKLIQSARGGR